jgi:CDP-paratose 2-epimerase
VKILISGICGFVGSTLADWLVSNVKNYQVFGFDNFSRPGSEVNLKRLRYLGVKVYHCDIRCQTDIDNLPKADWVIDAAANPSVTAGINNSEISSRQVVDHNLYGSINMLEYCKHHRAGFILLSTSRVYSIAPLANLELKVIDQAFQLDPTFPFVYGLDQLGVAESFSTQAPVSLYGATKIASELMALEYGEVFQFPVWINRCGVLAGKGQFGRLDQGIFSYWINSWIQDSPLSYIGFDGKGHQVRDCLHPRDLGSVLCKQMIEPESTDKPRTCNFAGGVANSMSLLQLSNWCTERFRLKLVGHIPRSRPYDIPWMVLNSSLAKRIWDWVPETSINETLEEIANHGEQHPEWLTLAAS